MPVNFRARGNPLRTLPALAWVDAQPERLPSPPTSQPQKAQETQNWCRWFTGPFLPSRGPLVPPVPLVAIFLIAGRPGAPRSANPLTR